MITNVRKRLTEAVEIKANYKAQQICILYLVSTKEFLISSFISYPQKRVLYVTAKVKSSVFLCLLAIVTSTYATKHML